MSCDAGRRASDGGSGFKAPKGGGGRGAGVMDAAASLVPNLSVLLRTGELGTEVHVALEAVTACLESAPAGTRLASACLGFVKEQLVDWPVAAPAQCQRCVPITSSAWARMLVCPIYLLLVWHHARSDLL
jgi:hypothetical protein